MNKHQTGIFPNISGLFFFHHQYLQFTRIGSVCFSSRRSKGSTNLMDTAAQLEGDTWTITTYNQSHVYIRTHLCQSSVNHPPETYPPFHRHTYLPAPTVQVNVIHFTQCKFVKPETLQSSIVLNVSCSHTPLALRLAASH